MEDLSRGESRNRQPQNNIDRMGHKKNDQAPKGFEGMNYEQKRRPYNETGRSKKFAIQTWRMIIRFGKDAITGN